MKVLAVIYSNRVSLYKVYKYGAGLMIAVVDGRTSDISIVDNEWRIILSNSTFIWADIIRNGGY